MASKIQKGLSAGRVQSSTLKIVVDREKEIRAFKPVEFWSIDGVFDKNIESILTSFDGEKIEKMTISNGDRAKEIKTRLDAESFKVHAIERKERKSSPIQLS